MAFHHYLSQKTLLSFRKDNIQNCKIKILKKKRKIKKVFIKKQTINKLIRLIEKIYQKRKIKEKETKIYKF